MSYIGNEPIVSATRTITEVTATAGQTVFTANGGYTVGYIDVFLNGAQLQTVDFTATNGTTITLTEAAQVGDVIRLVAWGTFSTNSIQGNLDFTGTAARIRGDMSNATALNRVAFQTSTTNSQTAVLAIPNGTSGTAQWQAYNNSDTTNSSFLGLAAVGSTDTRITSGIVGTGTFLPLTMYTGGSERLRIDTSGRVTTPAQPAFYAVYSNGYSYTLNAGNRTPAYGTTLYNIGNHYNTGNSRFTAPVTGLYEFTVSVGPNGTVRSSSGFIAIEFAINGTAITTYSSSCCLVTGTPEGGMITTYRVFLNASDYISTNIYSSIDSVTGGGSNSWTQTRNFFSGYLIG